MTTPFATLVDKRPAGVVLSASQIDRYDRCKRRWALEYIGGISSPQHPSAKLGTDIHAVLERWLRAGTPPDKTSKAGQVASRMLRNLPPPGTGVVERRFYLTTKNGFHHTGFIDWSGFVDSFPTIIDHKSTSDLKWAKTEADLHNDVQALEYALAGCLGFGVDEVQLLWGYGTTKNRDADTQAVRTKLRLPVIVEKFERVIEPLVAEIVEHRTRDQDPMHFPPNPAACGDYGGCPHQNICQLSANEKIRGLMSNPPTLASRLAGFPGNGAPAPAPVFSGGSPAVMFAPQVAPLPPQAGFSPQPQLQFSPQPQPQSPGPSFGGPQTQTPGYAAGAPAGFAPPQGGVTYPSPQPAAPGGVQTPLPNTQQNFNFSPPTVNPQPAHSPQSGYSPEQAPNPPESGRGGQVTAATAPSSTPEGETKRGRGRPAGSKNKEGTLSDAEVFLAGVVAFMSSPHWDGSAEKLAWAGEIALTVFRNKFSS